MQIDNSPARNTWALLLIVVIILLMSCSAAKRTAKQDSAIAALKDQFAAEKKQAADEAVADYLLNNPAPLCPDFNCDSCAFYGAGPGPTASDYTDTPRTAPPTVKPHSPVEFRVQRPTKIVLRPFEDLRKVNLLKDSLAQYRGRLAVANAMVDKITAQLVAEAKSRPGPWARCPWFIIASILGGSLAVTVFLLTRRK